MLRASISLESSYSSQTDLLATTCVTQYTAVMFSASSFGSTEPVLDPCEQGRISQMTLHANEISPPPQSQKVLLAQAQDVHSGHSEVPEVYLASHHTFRCSKSSFWLTSTREQETGRQGWWKTISCTYPPLQFLHTLGSFAARRKWILLQHSLGKESSKEKQISFFNKDLKETFTFNVDWMPSMRKELTLFPPFSFPPSCYVAELVWIPSQISCYQHLNFSSVTYSKWQHGVILELWMKRSHICPPMTREAKLIWGLNLNCKTCVSKHVWKRTLGLFEPLLHVMDHQLQLLPAFDSLMFSHKGEEEVIPFRGEEDK